MKNTFYLVRHGQTVWNTLGQTQGHGNSPLTELGISQAMDIAEALKEYNIDYIYSSDLGRAVETANIIGKILGLEVETTDAIREMGFGLWEGMTIEAIKEKYADDYEEWRNHPENTMIKGGESLGMVRERTEKLIDYLNDKYEGKNILLVSHAIVVKVMLLSFLGTDMKNIYRIRQDNTALNIITYGNLGPCVIKMNDTTHIKCDKNKGESLKKSALE